jgi:cytochrome P450
MAPSTTPAPPAVDLSWGRSFANGFPHEFFTRLRREHPVWWHDPTEHTPGGIGFWVVSRYAEAVAIMKDPATFSSGVAGTAIGDSPGAGLSLNQTDDPQHRRLRSLVSTGFTPRTIGRLEGDLRSRIRQILDAVPVGEPFDFVALVAQELPLQAICLVLGVPQEDRAELARIVNDAIEAETGEVLGTDHVKVLGAYGADLIRHKRSQPADDILSIIVHAGDDDGTEPLTDRELKAFFNLLFPAGAETTRGAIGGGVLAFIENPDQWARLRDHPELMRTAVEEIVRWTSPSVYKRRTATGGTVLAGAPIAEGDKVTYWEMSANRDEAVFAEPFRFDVGRDPNPHVGFGVGTHFCLGASLARLEIRVVLEELLARFDRFELAGQPTWPRNNRLVGMTRFPVIAHLEQGA